MRLSTVSLPTPTASISSVPFWFSTVFYVTVTAVVVAFVWAAQGRNPVNVVSFGFACGGVIPLLLFHFFRPRGFFGQILLPPDFTFIQKGLVDLAFAWLFAILGGLIAALLLNRTPGRKKRPTGMKPQPSR